MELRTRPKSDYLSNASWEQLILLTKHWQSDVKYYADEIRFFRHLTDQQLLWLENDRTIMAIRALHNKLLDLAKRCNALEDTMNRHLSHIQELYENPFSHDEHVFRNEHVSLEDDLTEFTRYFRALKK